jgi:hypothetical protein
MNRNTGMVYIYRSLFNMQEIARHTISLWQSTDKQVDVTGVFQLSRLQAAFHKFYGRYNDLICPYNLSLGHMLSDVSYQSLSRSWHTDLDYGLYRLSNLEIGLTVGVTCQQGILTSKWHLIPPLIYSEVRVRPFSDLYFRRTYEINYCSLFLSLLIMPKLNPP